MPPVPDTEPEPRAVASVPDPAPAIHDSVKMSRLVLGVAAAAGADARELARDADLPAWLLADNHAMIASARHARLWELAEHALADPYLGLTAVYRHQVGDLGLYDYLFTTAANLAEALQIGGDYFHLISTNCMLQPEPATDGQITYAYRHVEAAGRGEELWTQFSIAGFCARISATLRRLVVPAHIAFAQPPPHSYQAFAEAFGTRNIDFGAPVTTFTLRAEDLEPPMPGADAELARTLRGYAAALPQPLPADLLSRFRHLLAEAIGNGTPSLEALARRLAVSTRTLQRRLAEHGTTWRTELEIARQRRAERALQDGPSSTARLARQLGYSDPRSVRRALRRWERSEPFRA